MEFGAELREGIERWLPDYGYVCDAAARERFARYLELVAEANQRVRLVGSADAETLVRRHLGESLFLGRVLELEGQRLVDIGSGAGFPGLALALGWPELKTTLVESTGKKTAFLERAVEGLGLGGRVEVWKGYLERRPGPGRVPLAGAGLVTLRALDKMEEVPGWLGNWLVPEVPEVPEVPDVTVAFWVGEARAAAWRALGPAPGGVWRWSVFHRLPGSRERGIVLGWLSVPRGTMREGTNPGTPAAESATLSLGRRAARR